jgi:hypothetical protein
MEKENIAEFYYAKLKDTTNPGLTLATFYQELLGRTITKSEIIMYNRLIKVFGRFTVFLATLDLVNVQNLTDVPYGLLFKICKDRIEKLSQNDITTASSTDLSRDIASMEREQEKMKNNKIKVTKSMMEGLE